MSYILALYSTLPVWYFPAGWWGPPPPEIYTGLCMAYILALYSTLPVWYFPAGWWGPPPPEIYTGLSNWYSIWRDLYRAMYGLYTGTIFYFTSLIFSSWLVRATSSRDLLFEFITGYVCPIYWQFIYYTSLIFSSWLVRATSSRDLYRAMYVLYTGNSYTIPVWYFPAGWWGPPPPESYTGLCMACMDCRFLTLNGPNCSHVSGHQLRI